jgi:hypothetical protein
MTFWPAYKAMRSIAAGQNVAEKNSTKGVARLGFFVARTASAVRIYRPVMRSKNATIIFSLNNIHLDNMFKYLTEHIFDNNKFKDYFKSFTINTLHV